MVFHPSMPGTVLFADWDLASTLCCVSASVVGLVADSDHVEAVMSLS